MDKKQKGITEYLSEEDKKKLIAQEAEKQKLEVVSMKDLVGKKFHIASKSKVETAYGETILVKISEDTGFFANKVISEQGLDFEATAYYTITENKSRNGRIYYNMLKL